MSSSPKVCYNPECNNPTPELPREGWRLKSGDLAALCDRCASTYDEGRFCETFHSRASGWRHCESCGKRIHCGCIISSQVFVLLDSGGVECLMCARKNVVVTSNPAWLPSLIPLSERLKEASMRNWCQSAGSGPMPWRQGSTLFSYSITEPEMLPRVPPEVDKSSVVDKFNISEQFPAPLLEKKTIENFPQKLMNGCLNFGAPEVYKKGKTGNSHGEHHNSCLNISRQCSPLKEDLSIPQFGLTVPCTSANETRGQIGVFGTHSRPSPPSSLTKQLHGNLRSGVDLLGKTQTHYGNSQGYF